MQTTNFSEEEVYRQWCVVEEFFVFHWNVGRGNKGTSASTEARK
ncbi:hypothetical protein PF010_g362 [Phytophthora fragariae]|uniref:Uncharacterized protein n=1 Tax=Phytophthora fragariae TaxID=53985 RepID=A0A6G0M3R1_9STRA|nr:hypothetical protein PF003_g9797 [Phytophthora fragariae]KAE9139977.1 hypothetical protein PF010_g362 [Phytophthora fragariae]